jgi:hypothetical protein
MLLALGVLGALHAQTSVRDQASALILGESYFSITAGYQDLDGHRDIHDGEFELNLPVVACLDSVFRYGYAFERGHLRHSIQDAEFGLNAWVPISSALRAFAGADIGYIWGDLVRKNDWYGRFRAGAECAIGSRLGLLAWAGWTDGRDKHIPDTWSGHAQVNCRITTNLALTAKVGWLETDDMTYGVGVLLRF